VYFENEEWEHSFDGYRFEKESRLLILKLLLRSF